MQLLLPILVGHQLAPFAVISAHGHWKAGGPGAASSSSLGWQWRPSPVRSVTIADSRELQCAISTGDDGRMVVMSWDGRLLGCVNVAKGRDIAKVFDPAPDVGAAGANASDSSADASAVAAAASGVLDASADALPADSTASRTETTATAAFDSGLRDSLDEAVVAAAAPPPPEPWAIPVDRDSRERYLTASAYGVLEQIEVAKARAKMVEDALSSGRASKLDYEEIQAALKYKRRSSAIAASQYQEASDKQEAAAASVMTAARRLSLKPGDDPYAATASSSSAAPASLALPENAASSATPLAITAAGMKSLASLDSRFRAIGQLLNQQTYELTPAEIALAEAKRHAQAVMASTTAEQFLPATRRASIVKATAGAATLPNSSSSISISSYGTPLPAPAAVPAVSSSSSDSSDNFKLTSDDPLRELSAEDRAEWASSQAQRRASLMLQPGGSTFTPAVGGGGGGKGTHGGVGGGMTSARTIRASDDVDDDGDGADGSDNDEDSTPFAFLSAADKKERERELRVRSK